MTTAAIASLSTAHILVAGDIMLDRYWHGQTSRISPEAPVPVVHITQIEERPGGAGNVALNIVALGASATVLALTGEDQAADSLKQLLDQSSVRYELQSRSESATITKLRVISKQQQLIRLDFEDQFVAARDDQFLDAYSRLLGDCTAVVLSDYAKGSLRDVQPLISAAHQAGKPVLVDPKGNDFSMYRGADLITPNMGEFQAVAGTCDNDDQLVEKGLNLLRDLDIGALLVTRGEHGMSLLQSGQAPIHMPTSAREVYDVTGAGDTVIAVLAAAMGASVNLKLAMELANTAAGIVVSKLGTATASAREIEDVLQPPATEEQICTDLPQLLTRVDKARGRGERVVMTNGCFDLLHAGHVHYLQSSRQLGDHLIVAINTDASVRRLKGDSRPINPLASRTDVLAALACVDSVIEFDDDTPLALITAVSPDVLVKGGDYRVEDIVGYEHVREYGGETVVLDFIEGESSSAIIKRIIETEQH